MAEIAIQYSSGTAFASGVIRRLCHSRFSHVDIVVATQEERGLLGVSGEDRETGDIGGVRVRSLSPWPYLEPPKTARLRVADRVHDAFMAAAHGEIGKPFDNGALWDFLSDRPGDRDWRNTASWFCSELIIYCFEKAEFFPYELIAAKNRITPADSLHLLNPFMSPENIAEFRA